MRFLHVLIHPRTTMRAILDQPRDRAVIPLVLLAMFSAWMRDASLHGFRAVAATGLPLWLFIVLPICAVLLTLGIFYVVAYVATFIGRQFEGSGDFRAVRSALAWGCAPIIVALVYRIPAAFLIPADSPHRVRLGEHMVMVDTARLEHGCGVALLVALLELAILLWYLFVTSNTLGEAHRFSSWRGLGTLLATFFVPVIIGIAAVLALRS